MLYSFYPCRSIRKQIWPCHKMVKAIPVLWTNLVVLEYPVLYTKFQCHRPFWFFFKVFTISGPGSHLGHVTRNTWKQSHGGSIWNLASKWLLFFVEEQKFETVEHEWPWAKVDEWPFPWIVINHQVLIFSTISINFHLTGFNSFLEIYSLSIFPYKNIRNQIWPCCKIGEGQPRVIIWIDWEYSSNQCRIPSLKFICLLVPEKKVLKINIWAWRPCWLCDIHHL